MSEPAHEPAPMPSYWALAGEVTHLHGQLDKLKAENAKLRQWLADVTESMGRVEKRCAKMRELVVDVHESLRADKAGMFHKLILVSMEDDMRELGIEVDE